MSQGRRGKAVLRPCSAELRVGLGDDGASAFARGGRLASLYGLLIIWPLIVVVAILVKVKMKMPEVAFMPKGGLFYSIFQR